GRAAAQPIGDERVAVPGALSPQPRPDEARQPRIAKRVPTAPPQPQCPAGGVEHDRDVLALRASGDAPPSNRPGQSHGQCASTRRIPVICPRSTVARIITVRPRRRCPLSRASPFEPIATWTIAGLAT